MMNILVINSGSSSIKYQLFKMPDENPLCSGIVERIGLDNASITHCVFLNGKEIKKQVPVAVPDHQVGMQEVGKLLTDPEYGVIKHPADIHVVGHRIVHGGEKLTRPTVITENVKKEIRRLFSLAPLHNPGHYQGIEVAQRLFHQSTHMAVFDTAFHQTLPEKAFRYAIPESFYTDQGIRVYGFHGISHQYVAKKAMEFLAKPDAKIITVHLGNGCSMAAINAGRSIDTTMGLTPLDGLVMGTRSGSIDPSVLLYLMSELNYSQQELNDLLNKKSGMLGLTGYSDMRDIQELLEKDDPRAHLAYEMYAYRIQKYIGAYAAALNGFDALVFTAGVGEHDAIVRKMVCSQMDFLGIRVDNIKNCASQTGVREICSVLSRVKVLVIPTNEELEIALQCEEMTASAPVGNA
jgi:acetate kinase